MLIAYTTTTLVQVALANRDFFLDVTTDGAECVKIIARFNRDQLGSAWCESARHDESETPTTTEWRPYYQDVIASDTVSVGSNTTRICIGSDSTPMDAVAGHNRLNCFGETIGSTGGPRLIETELLSWQPLTPLLADIGIQVPRGTRAFLVMWAVAHGQSEPARSLAYDTSRVPRIASLKVDECVEVRVGSPAQSAMPYIFCPDVNGIKSAANNYDPWKSHGATLYIGNEITNRNDFDWYYTEDENKDSAPQEASSPKRMGVYQRFRRMQDTMGKFSGNFGL